MSAHDNLIKQLKRHEGYRQHPYMCTAGKLTIGIGRNLEDKGISTMEADYLLANDVQDARSDLNGLISHGARTKMGKTREAVLINMLFNIGRHRLTGFVKMLLAVEAGDYEKAAVEMLDSKWATQVGKRAVELSAQMRTGEW